MNHAEQVPYDSTTQPEAEVVQFIRRHNAKRLAELNAQDDSRETAALLNRALRTLRPETA